MLKRFNHSGKKPTHLLIGARKSATSWIWKQLGDHPDVYAHPAKEIYYFNAKYKMGMDWYVEQFKTNRSVVFEATPDYFQEQYAKTIRRDLPEAKLIVCLRNPIERAYSHWKFGCYVGNCHLDFMSAWNNDWMSIRTRGLYHRHLKAFHRLEVLLYDDLQDDPQSFVENLYQFLGVKKHRSRFFAKKWIPGKVSQNSRDDEYRLISEKKMPDCEYRIVADYYKDTIELTEGVLERKLNWLNI